MGVGVVALASAAPNAAIPTTYGGIRVISPARPKSNAAPAGKRGALRNGGIHYALLGHSRVFAISDADLGASQCGNGAVEFDLDGAPELN